MKHRLNILAGLSLVALVVAACAPAAAPSPTAAPAKPAAEKPAPTQAPAKPAAEKPAAKAETKPAQKPAAMAADIKVPKPSGNLALKWGFSSTIGYSDLTPWITAQRLNKEGWEVKTIEFAQSELATEGLVRGEVQFASGATFQSLNAAQKGAPVKLVVEKNLNEWVLASVPGMKQCSDLTGKKLAVHSEGAVSTAMTKIWMENACGAKPTILIIAGSENRAAALMNGQIDATPLEMADWVNINTQQPGKFHVLENFSEGLPDLSTTGAYSDVNWLKENRAVAVAFIAELLKTNRMVKENPELIADAARQNLKEVNPEALPKIVEAYNSIDAFPPNGGFTPAKINGTIKFFVDGGRLQPGMTLEQAADLSILEEALKIVGNAPGKP